MDGTPVYTSTNHAGKQPYPVSRYNIGYINSYFEGSIDEALFYDRALSADEIVDVMNGRYNTNDLFVRAGAELSYQATVTNTNAAREINGFLIGQTQVITPNLPSPAILFNFDQPQRIGYFHNNNGDDNPAYCFIDTCPTSGVQGSDQNAIQFTGEDDYVVVPTLLQDSLSSFEIHFDIKLDRLPTSGETMYILDTNDAITNALDIYIDDTGTLIFDVQGANDPAARAEFNLNGTVGSWQSIDVDLTSGNYGNWLLNSTTTLGNGTLGNSLNGSNGLAGSIDDLMIHANDQETNAHYKFDQLTDYDGTVFHDTQANVRHGTCSPPACPTVTLNTSNGNRYLTFDGTDDTFYTTASNNREQFTFNFDLYLDALPSSSVTVYDGRNIHISINPSGQVIVDRTGSYDNMSTATVPVGEWTTISLEYDEFSQSGNCYYESYLTVDGIISTANYYISSSCGNHSVNLGNAWFGSTNGNSNHFAGRMDNISVVFANYDFEPATSNIRYLNRATDLPQTDCDTVFACPNGVVGQFNEGLSFDGIEQYMNLGPLLNPAEGDFTVALWFNPADYDGDMRRILHQQDEEGSGRVWLSQYGNGELFTFLGGASIDSGQIPITNTWHHAAVVYQQDNLTLYLNGEPVANSLIDMESNNGDVILGRQKDNDVRFFKGMLDELVVFDTALSPDAIQFLMNSQLPVIDVPDKFIPFSAAPLTTVDVSGVTTVNEYTDSSVSQFDQEVEAAIKLENGVLVYPTYSNITNSIDLFMPFEEAPASTTFKNLVDYTYDGTYYASFDPYCTETACPTAGLRGANGRSVYFDGIDDYITIDFTEVYQFAEWTPGTLSMWVKGKQGTIFDTTDHYEIDMNSLKHQYNSNEWSVDLNFPKDEWFHLAIVADDPTTGNIHVYLNSTLVYTNTSYASNDVDKIILGRNFYEFDYFDGYIDDLRLYSNNFSAGDIQSLYQNSTPVFRFEFDEESSANLFVDSSPKAYIGTPDYETCTTLTLNRLTIHNASTNTQNLYVAIDDEWLLYHPLSNYNIGTSEESNLSTIICDNLAISGGVVYTDSSSSQLGTLNTSVTISGTQSQTFNSGGDSLTISYTIGSDLTYQPNPIPGTDGQIGNTALFDGNGAIELTSTVPLELAEDDFTIMAWVKTDQNKGSLLVKSDGDQTWEAGEKALHITGSGQLRFRGNGNSSIVGTTPITDSLWHHVAVVWDYNGSGTGGTGKIYIDGVDDTASDNYTINNIDNDGDSIRIGDTYHSNDVVPFVGQLDELVAYQYALSDAEIYNTYLLELRWYRDNASYQVVIDEDVPAIEMLSTYPYRTDGYIQLASRVQDATSSISLVQFGLKGPGASSFVWQTAVPCADSSIVYCPSFTSSGEGAYEVQLRAIDAVGNETISQIYIFYVDATAPVVSASSGGSSPLSVASSLAFTITKTSDFDWTIALSGEVTDPNIEGVSGSGVEAANISVILTDERGHVLGTPNQAVDSLIDDAWTVSYEVEGVAPLGTYTVTVTAADVLGNITTTVLGTIDLDERATHTQFADLLPNYAISGTQTITGVVMDHPVWFGLNLDLHFEEESGASLFYDYGRYGNHAICTACPTLTTDTPFGRALAFDGLSDTLVISNDLSLDEQLNDEFTIALWLKPDSTQTDTSSTSNIILSKWDTNSNSGAYLLGYENQTAVTPAHLTFSRATTTTQAILTSTTSLDNTFHHIAVVKQDGMLSLYVDGFFETSTPDITGEIITDTNLFIGSFANNNAYFAGIIDELLIMDDALTADQLYALAQSNVNGVGNVELALEQIDFSTLSEPVDEGAQAWQTATLDQSGTTASEWSYTLANSGLENYYRLHLRSQDSAGNQEATNTIWQGLIDQVAPTISGSGVQGWINSTPVTTITFTFSDFLLNEYRYTQPCETGELISLTHNDSNVPYDGMPYEVSAVCQVQGHETSYGLTACDLAGNCTTETIVPEVAHRLEITAVNTTDAQLNWNQPSGYCGYTVHESASPYFTPSMSTEIGSTSSSLYDLLSSLSGTSYYQIKAQSCISGTTGSNEVGIFTFGIVPGE